MAHQRVVFYEAMGVHLYKVSLILKLILADPVVCTNVHNWVLYSFHIRIVSLIHVLLTNNSWLRLSGFVNAQNTHHSGTKKNACNA